MKQETAVKMKFGIWGLIGGAVIVMIIGFVWGGWVTGGTATEMSGEAVEASQAAICVAQFMLAPDHEAKLAEFRALQSWKQGDYIRENGWDKMPGQKEAGYPVANACSKGIEILIAK